MALTFLLLFIHILFRGLCRMLLSHMKHLRCRIFWFLQAYVAVGFSQLRLLFVVDMWQTCIIFYALLISVMIHLSGFIVHVKIAFDFELGSLMKSIFVELSIPCLAELSCLDLKTSCSCAMHCRVLAGSYAAAVRFH